MFLRYNKVSQLCVYFCVYMYAFLDLTTHPRATRPGHHRALTERPVL